MRSLAAGIRIAAARWAVGVVVCALVAATSPPLLAADSVCARVQIEIAQEATLERQAFDAHMRISNGLPQTALEQVGVEVSFTDADGVPVAASSDPNNTTALFFIRIDSLAGIDHVDGSGTVAANTTADIHWLIIPAPGASNRLATGTLYYAGATLIYTMGGRETTVEVTPDWITVKPMPEMTLDYFLPADVHGDDAFTPAIEPPVPFSLGLRVSNQGHGTAWDLKIDSAQPRIVDNDQGLLVGFAIEGSEANGAAVTPSLRVPLGDVGPSTAATARWIMSCSLSGRFTDFSVECSHADELGGELTSLIAAANTHTLVHDVLVDLAGRDSIRDFLAHDSGAYRVYESDATDGPVLDQSTVSTLTPLGGGHYTLTTPVTAGFLYVQLTDPSNGGMVLREAVRSDGKRLKSDNAWLSKTRQHADPWQYFVCLFDANSPGSYTLTFEAAEDQPQPPVLQFIADQVRGEGRQLSFIVQASDPDGTTPSLAAAPLPVGATFADQGDGTAIFDWTPAVGQAGTYQVTFTASDGVLTDSQAVHLTVLPDNTAAEPPALAESGSLDGQFGAAGRNLVDAGGDDWAAALVVQDDGTLLTAGVGDAGTRGRFALVRWLADGIPDPAFGTVGVVTTQVGPSDDEAFAMALQPDGKILVAGRSYTDADHEDDFAVARYLPNGNLDPAFGTDGVTIVDIDGSTDAAHAIGLQRDGRIILAGPAYVGGQFRIALVCLKANGAQETAFGPPSTPGIVVTPIGPGDDVANGLAIQSDYKIVVAGRSGNGTNDDVALARYDRYGELDAGFGTAGVVTTPVGAGDDSASAVVLQTDGKIVVAGITDNGDDSDVLVARYGSTGALDTSFNGTGMATTDFGAGDDGACALRLDPAGRIVVAGYAAEGPIRRAALARYTPAGALDTRFSGDGTATFAMGADSAGEMARAVQIAGGRIIVAGKAWNGADYDTALARFQGEPWEIAINHGGGVGTLWCPLPDGYVEARRYTTTLLRVRCSEPWASASIDVTSLTITDSQGHTYAATAVTPDAAQGVVRFTVPAVPDRETYTLAFAALITDMDAQTASVTGQVVISTLVGDANGDGVVNVGDLLAVRARAGQPVTAATARFDVNGDGVINVGDLLAVRANDAHHVP